MPDINVRDEGYFIDLPAGKKLTIVTDGGNIVIEEDGTITGDVTGNLTGDVTGNLTGAPVQAATAFGSDGAVTPGIGVASLSKGSAGAYTLAAPGASNVGKRLLIIASTAQAHVVTVTGLDSTEDTLTFGGAIGDSVELYARSATLWTIVALNAVTPSTA